MSLKADKLAKTGDIVGLYASTNGRSCNLHPCCGEQLELGDKVAFRRRLVQVDGVNEFGIEVILMNNYEPTCTVGFLPRHVVARCNHEAPIWFAEIIEICSTSNNEIKRKLSHENKGMARYRRIDNMQMFEVVNINVAMSNILL